MRKIIIPQKALERHEAMLGKALLEYLYLLANGGVVNYVQREKYSAKNTESKYWDWVYGQFKDKHILTATPRELLRFAKENKSKLEELGIRSKKVDEVIRALFAWDEFRAGKVLVFAPLGKKRKRARILWSEDKAKIATWEGWSISEFVRQIDVRYCPYCNGETVGVVDYINREVKKTKTVETLKETFSAIDHILPKKYHPLLDLSLYNLVPVCYRCNSQFKGEDDPLTMGAQDGEGDPDGISAFLHPYVHNVHKWFRFDYRPRAVENIFLNEDSSKRNNDDSPLSITLKIPALTGSQSLDKEVYFDVIRGYLDEFHILDSYRDLYATEINEILKMEMICTPTFVETMKGAWPGMGDEDFDLVFRRTSLDPREINKHRFAKLIIDLHKQIGDEVFLEEWGKNSDEEQSAKARREAHQAAWEARKKVIEESFHEKLSSSSAK